MSNLQPLLRLREIFEKECKPLRAADEWSCIRCGSCCEGKGKFTELGGAEYLLGLNRYFPPVFVEIADSYPIVGQFKIIRDGSKLKQVCPYFSSDNLCLIYDERPLSCKAFPFSTPTLSEQAVVFINKLCKGYGRGSPVMKSNEWKLKQNNIINADKDLRSDITEAVKSLVAAVNDTILSADIGTELYKRGWLQKFHGKGPLKNYIAKGRVDIPTDDGTYPLIPDKVVWKDFEFLAKIYDIEVEALDVT